MFCAKCGSYNEDTNKWCRMCGYKLEGNHQETDETVEILTEFTEEEIAPEIISSEPDSSNIRDYLGWSIIAAILGSIIFGVAAVIFSGITKAELAAGNVEKAKAYSDHTKFFCLISLSVAIVKFIFIVVALIIVFSITQMPWLLY